MMRKVTCISYHNSGSGAVDDYLREFTDFSLAPSDVECRFLQDPDGISDLEFNLIDNWHRLNSDFAIKRYLKFARQNKRTYSLIFGDAWVEETKKYINNLITFEYPGYWHADINEQPFFSWFIFKCRRAWSKLMPKKYRKTQDYNYFPKLKSYHVFLTKEEFYNITKEYTERLCRKLSKNESDYIVLDQCVSTTNVSRYLNYLKDLKVIIVDRDPRDIYIQETKEGMHVLPHDPRLFAIQYRDMRRSIEKEISDYRVLRVQFEDLIYHYESTVMKINEFLGIDETTHKYARQYFNPDKSIKNTRMWERDSRYQSQVTIIEQELGEFLYQC